MEDTIEICAGCGKMPRAIDNVSGSFVCTRCGNRTTTSVKAEEYEKVVLELDQKFHAMNQKKRVEEAASVPLELEPPKKKPVKAAPKAKEAPQKKKTASKSKKK